MESETLDLGLKTLDVALKLVQVVGIPVAIILFFANKRRERLDREYGTYDALDDKYIDYLKLCLDHPELDVADVPRDVGPLSPEQKHQELILFTILMAILERAFLMYRDKSGKIRRRQWTGWDLYIGYWCSRANFRSALPLLRDEFDTEFVKYLDEKAREAA